MGSLMDLSDRVVLDGFRQKIGAGTQAIGAHKRDRRVPGVAWTDLPGFAMGV